MAELIARELNASGGRVRDETRALGPDPEAAARPPPQPRGPPDRAAGGFQEIERRYDRETRHGNDVDRQTEWFARVKRGLAAVRER